MPGRDPSQSFPVHESFDYIVVGGGTAGCVLANRLSADRTRSVLLLEAGPPDRNPWLKIPIGFSRTFRDPAVNWCYETEPQAALGGRRIFWPCGRVLGGSSAINGMIHIRGHPADFDEWADTGLPEWSWNDVLPYFRRMEGQRCAMPDVYGSDGPIAISELPVRNRASEAFIDAAVSCGVARVRSFNLPRQEGAGYYQINTLRGFRCSASTAYLRPAAGRPNLAVVTGASVCSLRLEGRTAIAVEYDRGDGRRLAFARAEILVCGGAVGSPALLQRSGIGHPGDLASAEIQVRVALPGVGRNLQDHFGVRYIARLRRPITVNDDFRRPWRLAGHLLRYAVRRTGQLAIGGAESGAFARSRAALSRPDLQFHFLPLSNERAGWSFHSFSGVTANVCQLRPWSRGRVIVASSDPADVPRIDPNYLGDTRDLDVLVEGLRLARRIFAAPPMDELVAAEVNPGSERADDRALGDYVRSAGSTVFHPVGTCAMGAGSDAVLDASCRVRGMERLRVVDASSFPTLVSGNTNAAVVMLAEKIAAGIG